MEFRYGMLRDMWTDFETRVIAREASEAQREDMYQAFLGGALAYQVAFCAAFKNDGLDGKALENLSLLEKEVTALTCDFMLGNVYGAMHAAARVMSGSLPPDEAGQTVAVHMIDGRSLLPAEVDELNALIQKFIASKSSLTAQ